MIIYSCIQADCIKWGQRNSAKNPIREGYEVVVQD